MLRTRKLLRALAKEEDGHAPPACAALVGAVGAIVLGAGAAAVYERFVESGGGNVDFSGIIRYLRGT